MVDDDWAEEYYRGQWMVMDMTNMDDQLLIEGSVFYGPFDTERDAADFGATNCSLFATIAMEPPWGGDE